jgi:hypothetical protein
LTIMKAQQRKWMRPKDREKSSYNWSWQCADVSKRTIFGRLLLILPLISLLIVVSQFT